MFTLIYQDDKPLNTMQWFRHNPTDQVLVLFSNADGTSTLYIPLGRGTWFNEFDLMNPTPGTIQAELMEWLGENA